MKTQQEKFEYVVISDTHISTRSHSDEINRFSAFLKWITNTVKENRKVILIGAGDLFNLDIMDKNKFTKNGISPSERIASIMDKFPSLVQSMAWFIKTGNKIKFLAGNHDIELFHPDAEMVFKNYLRKYLPEVKAGIDKLIDFSSPNKIAIGDHIHIEHGHRFDGDNCFEEDAINKIKRGIKPGFPLGSMIEKILLSRLPHLDYSGFSRKTPLPLLIRILLKHKLIGGLNIILRYFSAAIFLLFISTFRFLENLISGKKSNSTIDSPFKLFRRMYIDRSIIFISFLIWLSATPVFIKGRIFEWLMLLIIFTTLLIEIIIEGNRYSKQSEMACIKGAESIVSSSKAQLVILAHSHEPASIKNFNGKSKYINTGSFQCVSEKGFPFVRIVPVDGHSNIEYDARLEYFKG